ncbi:hypothetical protein SKAU_G00054010 [Synaphobranchus kaupii]|uniref:Uncharacterized protein n=1 Tax=Synaphobranchus kaupii TaxID=118154 RepID=A0A9Q1J8X4_SYNKA|nr:hypothetical protein SKAU_G00054010 [Synaphobranchus kaupii]
MEPEKMTPPTPPAQISPDEAYAVDQWSPRPCSWTSTVLAGGEVHFSRPSLSPRFQRVSPPTGVRLPGRGRLLGGGARPVVLRCQARRASADETRLGGGGGRVGGKGASAVRNHLPEESQRPRTGSPSSAHFNKRNDTAVHDHESAERGTNVEAVGRGVLQSHTHTHARGGIGLRDCHRGSPSVTVANGGVVAGEPQSLANGGLGAQRSHTRRVSQTEKRPLARGSWGRNQSDGPANAAKSGRYRWLRRREKQASDGPGFEVGPTPSDLQRVSRKLAQRRKRAGSVGLVARRGPSPGNRKVEVASGCQAVSVWRRAWSEPLSALHLPVTCQSRLTQPCSRQSDRTYVQYGRTVRWPRILLTDAVTYVRGGETAALRPLRASKDDGTVGRGSKKKKKYATKLADLESPL